MHTLYAVPLCSQLQGRGTGWAVWDGAVAAAKHLEQLALAGRLPALDPPAVLELGSGTGLAGLAAAVATGLPTTLTGRAGVVQGAGCGRILNHLNASRQGGRCAGPTEGHPAAACATAASSNSCSSPCPLTLAPTRRPARSPAGAAAERGRQCCGEQAKRQADGADCVILAVWVCGRGAFTEGNKGRVPPARLIGVY